jgi:hypothetical protein
MSPLETLVPTGAEAIRSLELRDDTPWLSCRTANRLSARNTVMAPQSSRGGGVNDHQKTKGCPPEFRRAWIGARRAAFAGTRSISTAQALAKDI